MVKTTNGETPSKKGLKTVLKKFREHTKNPEIFLTAQSARAEKIKSLVKSLYDHGQLVDLSGADPKRQRSYLDELIVDEMDEEQIWQQLELKNEQLLGQDLPDTSKLLSMGSKRLQLAFRSEEEETGDLDDDEDQEMNDAESGSEEEQQEVPAREQNGKVKMVKKKDKKAKRSIVDDRFFRLDDMAKFLDEEDKREERRLAGKPDVDPLIEIDYFSADVGEDDDDSEGEDLKYSDFFDDDEDEDDDEEGNSEDREQEEEDQDASNDEQNEGSDQDEEMEDGSGSEAEEEGKAESEEELNSEDEVERNRRLRFELYNASGDFLPGSTSKKVPIERPESSESEAEENAENGDEEEEEQSPKKRDDGPKSSFELRQEKLQQRIEKMENQLLEAKPWQLKGEISADTRPQNSLLEEVLEFESTTRPAPVITEETTMRLEDIIRQRIKNKAWDDVERKVRPPDNPREFRKQLVLDGEKSKESLAQIYERDYLKQLEKANPEADQAEEEEPKEHLQIRAAMKTLLAQLDALSNFHYTPRPAVPELKIITNTPAISMEEVAPLATSDATLLAPEEVHNRPKGDVMSKDERARADKNRERRLKKRFQREKFARQAEKEQKQLEKGIKPKGKEAQEKLLKKVTKAKNVSTMVEGGKAGVVGKSSTAFFSQLQDEVSTQIKGKLGGQKKSKKNGAAGLQATHVKL